MNRYSGGTEPKSVRLPKEMVRDLEAYAEKFKQTFSDLVIEAVSAWLVDKKQQGS